MPQIIVTTDADDRAEARVLYQERVVPGDFRSTHFSRQLVERLGWAVGDAESEPPVTDRASHADLTQPERRP